MHKDKNLLDFSGNRSDYRSVGRYLARMIHTPEERERYCFSPRKSSHHVELPRQPAIDSDAKAFRGEQSAYLLKQ